MNEKNKIFLKSFLFIVLFGLTIQAMAAWVDPASTPTGANAEPPINVSSTTQIKRGSLGITGDFVANSSEFAGNLNVVGTGYFGNKLTLNQTDPGRNFSYTYSGTNRFMMGADATKFYMDSVGIPLYLNSTGQNIITGAGNVGIGIIAPTQTLDVNGNVNVASGKCFMVNGTCITSGGSSQWTGTTGNPIYYTGGNVGVGTNSPSARLSVDANSAYTALTSTPTIRMTGSGLSTGLRLNIGMINASPFPVIFQTDSTSSPGSTFPIALNPYGGNVGIGTSSPTNKLSINQSNNTVPGTGVLTDAATYGIQLSKGGSDKPFLTLGVSDSSGAYIQSWGSKPLIINSTGNDVIFNAGTNGGNVGIGTTTPGAKLEINGNVLVSNVAPIIVNGWVYSGTTYDDDSIDFSTLPSYVSLSCDTSSTTKNCSLTGTYTDSLASANGLTYKVDNYASANGFIHFKALYKYVNNQLVGSTANTTNLVVGSINVGNIFSSNITTAGIVSTGSVQSTSGGFIFPDGTIQTSASSSGSYVFTGNNLTGNTKNFKIPDNVNKIWVTAVSGGGGGGRGGTGGNGADDSGTANYSSGCGGGGGGGGGGGTGVAVIFEKEISVSPGSSITLYGGAGGKGADLNNTTTKGQDGGSAGVISGATSLIVSGGVGGSNGSFGGSGAIGGSGGAPGRNSVGYHISDPIRGDNGGGTCGVLWDATRVGGVGGVGGDGGGQGIFANVGLGGKGGNGGQGGGVSNNTTTQTGKSGSFGEDGGDGFVYIRW